MVEVSTFDPRLFISLLSSFQQFFSGSRFGYLKWRCSHRHYVHPRNDASLFDGCSRFKILSEKCPNRKGKGQSLATFLSAVRCPIILQKNDPGCHLFQVNILAFSYAEGISSDFQTGFLVSVGSGRGGISSDYVMSCPWSTEKSSYVLRSPSWWDDYITKECGYFFLRFLPVFFFFPQ